MRDYFLLHYRYKWEIPFTFTTSDEVNFNKTNKDIFWIHKNQSSGMFLTKVEKKKP